MGVHFKEFNEKVLVFSVCVCVCVCFVVSFFFFFFFFFFFLFFCRLQSSSMISLKKKVRFCM